MIVHVPPDLAAEQWSTLAPLIKRATDETNGCYEPTDVLRDILSGKQRLWVAWNEKSNTVDAAMTAGVIDYPRRRVCRICFIAGTNMRRWLKDFTQAAEEFAVAEGATAIEGGGRRGWQRMWPGARDGGALLFKDL